MIDERLPNVSYHVRALLELGCIELVQHGPATRGDRALLPRADEAVLQRPRLEAACPRPARTAITDVALQMIWDDTSEAIKTGTFDSRTDRHLSRSPLHARRAGLERDEPTCCGRSWGRRRTSARKSAKRLAKSDEDRNPYATRDDALRVAQSSRSLGTQSASSPRRRRRARCRRTLTVPSGTPSRRATSSLREVLAVAHPQQPPIPFAECPERLLHGQPQRRAGQLLVVALCQRLRADNLSGRPPGVTTECPARLVARDLEQPGQRRVRASGTRRGAATRAPVPPARPPPHPVAAATDVASLTQRDAQARPVPGRRRRGALLDRGDEIAQDSLCKWRRALIQLRNLAEQGICR